MSPSAPACPLGDVPCAPSAARCRRRRGTQRRSGSASRWCVPIASARAGRPHRPRARQRAQSEEDGHQPRRRPVKDIDQKKKKDEEKARSNRLKKSRFVSAPTGCSICALLPIRYLAHACLDQSITREMLFSSTPSQALSRSSRRRILPTGVFGSSVRNSTIFGRL